MSKSAKDPISSSESAASKSSSSAGPGKKSKTGLRRRKDLSLLHTMPLDVLFEILSRLSPKDLISVSRVNQEFCKLLWSRGATTIWKAVREAVDGPEPHPDISEPRWAVMMFGGSFCQSCNAPNVNVADFGIRRRVCRECKRKNLVPTDRVKKRYPQYDPVIIELIPSTGYRGSWSHSGAYGALHWKSDIDEIGTHWNLLQENIQLGLPNAVKEAEEFRQRKKHIREVIEKNLQPYMDWCVGKKRSVIQVNREARNSRADEIFNRLRELGYEEVDIQSIATESEVRQDRELTGRIWNTIKSKLITKLTANKRKRYIKQNESFIEPLYDSYMKTVKADQWHLLPTFKQFLWYHEVDPLVFAPAGTTSTSPIVKDIVPKFPSIMLRWREGMKNILRNLLADSGDKKKMRLIYGDGTNDLVSQPESYIPTDGEPDPLDLATSVFKCHGYGCPDSLLQWENALYHLSCLDWGHKRHLKMSPQAKKMTEDIIQLTGLDPALATTEDMDRSSLKVFCEACYYPQAARPHNRVVYSWRDAVQHAMETHQREYQSKPSWRVLSSDELTHVLEEAAETRRSMVWACNHCNKNYRSWSSFKAVRKHLATAHDISEPMLPDDLIFHPSFPRSLRLKYWEAENLPDGWIPHGRLACCQCTFNSDELADVGDHLADDHDIDAEPEDYYVRKLWFGYLLPRSNPSD